MQVVRFLTRAVAVLLLVAVAVKALQGRKVSLLAETFLVATAVTVQLILAFTMQAVAVHQCKTHHKALHTVKAVLVVAVMVALTHLTLSQLQVQQTQVAVAVAV
jgi:hypothetical protein